MTRGIKKIRNYEGLEAIWSVNGTNDEIFDSLISRINAMGDTIENQDFGSITVRAGWRIFWKLGLAYALRYSPVFYKINITSVGPNLHSLKVSAKNGKLGLGLNVKVRTGEDETVGELILRFRCHEICRRLGAPRDLVINTMIKR